MVCWVCFCDTPGEGIYCLCLHLLSLPQVSVLVMCHTRELAFQISKEYERFSKYMPSVKVSQGERLGGLRVWGVGGTGDLLDQ